MCQKRALQSAAVGRGEEGGIMGSKDREVRLRQREQVETQLAARLALLKDRGIEGKAVDRDPTVRKLRAQIVDSKRRLSAIDAKEALARKLAEQKAAKAQAPKEKKKKGEGRKVKAAEAEKKTTGGKKKKKKEKKT
jgi:hypothetical protein